MTTTKSKLDKIPEELQATLLDGLDHAMGDWGKYLDTMNLFTAYSFNNAILIYMQQKQRKRTPDGQVAGYKTWPKAFKRHVKKGAKSYKILAPILVPTLDKKGSPLFNSAGKPMKHPIGFQCKSIFDHRDTEGEPLPEPPKRNPMQQLDGEVSENLFEAFSHVACSGDRRIAVRRHVPIDKLGGAHGRCSFNGTGRASLIEIADIKPASAASTFAHELAHAILHNREDYEGHMATSIKELEAESVAYLVMNHYGIDTGDKAFDYILDWQKKTLKADQVREAMLGAGDRIAKAYKQITKVVDAYLEGEGA